MAMIPMRFDDEFNLIKVESPFVSRYFDEIFDGDKLAVICENTAPLDNLRREDARNKVILEKYLNQSFELRCFNVEKNCHRTSYEQNEDLCTRVQAQSSSAQGMLRESRHFIFNDNYIDFDMSNAHPRIVLKLCRELNLECPVLTEYVASREHILSMCQSTGKSREFYKKLFISLMYGKKKVDIKSENVFVAKFATEFKDLSKKITDSFPGFKQTCIALRKSKGKDYNHDAACLSHLCQTFESKFLDMMFEVLLLKAPKHANKSIPCFDGLMVHKSCFDDKFTAEDFIKTCEEKVGLPDVFKLEKKSMQEMHDIVHQAYKYSCESNGEHIERFLKNQRASKIRSYKKLKKTLPQGFMHEPQTNIIDFIRLINNEYEIWPDAELLEAFFEAHCNRYLANIAASHGTLICNVSKELICEQKLPNAVVQFYKRSGHVQSTTFHNLVLTTNLINKVNKYTTAGSFPFSPVQPPRCPEGVFNTFIGLRATYKKVENISSNLSAVLKHMFEVLSNEDEKVLDYLLLWFSAIFRNPGYPSKRCLIFTSTKHQIGKGIFLNWVADKVFGSTYGHFRKQAEFLTCGFNKEFEKSIFNVMDEVPQLSDMTEGKALADTFKSYITEPHFEIIEKGKTPVQRFNSNNFIITSNDKCPVYITPNDERFFKVSCGEMYSKNTKYFNAIGAILTQETADEFYSYCYDYESKFGQHVLHQPQTESLLESKQICTQNSVKFITHIHDLISDGILCNGKTFDEEYLNDDILGDLVNNYDDVKGKVRISSKFLYPVFEKWAKAEGIKKIVKKSTFMEEIESTAFVTNVNIARVLHALISRD